VRVLFRGRRARKLPDLVTALVTRKRDGWNVQFISDGRAPDGFQADSLAAAVHRADRDVDAMYALDDPARATAELTYAIYPWKSGGRIFEVAPTPDGLLARSIENRDETLTAANIDELVISAERAISDPSEVLFQWDKRVRDLG
jgi:hypothetical protein